VGDRGRLKERKCVYIVFACLRERERERERERGDIGRIRNKGQSSSLIHPYTLKKLS